MSSISNVLDTGAVALAVKQITGSTQDSAVAAGYSAWVNGVTGSMPSVVADGSMARIVLSDAQAVAMRQSIESSVFATKKGGNLKIEFSPVINPLLLKYLVPSAALFFFLGYMVRSKI